MGRLARFWDSSLGKKVVMAVTGLLMVGFVLGHMVGNLQLFVGPERLNAYAHLLHGPLAELVWGARVVLLGAVVLHATAAWQLARRAEAARPVDYAGRVPQVSTLASRTMRWGGVLLAAFIVFHLLHFTTGQAHPEFVQGDVYRNVIVGFRQPAAAIFYLLAMAGLGLHLYHGIWSSPRTLGLTPPTPAPLHRRVALVIAVVVAVGFAAVPLAVMLGVVK